MKHSEAFTSPRGENWDGLRGSESIPDCDGELIDPNTSYSSDVYWEVFTCSKCFAVVFTVEGTRHWWNHHGNGSETRMAQITEMKKRKALAQAILDEFSIDDICEALDPTAS